MTVTERQNYDSIMWTEIDRMATEDFALRKAAEEGEARGMAKVIKAWLSNGVQAQVIAESLGISVDEVNALAAE